MEIWPRNTTNWCPFYSFVPARTIINILKMFSSLAEQYLSMIFDPVHKYFIKMFYVSI